MRRFARNREGTAMPDRPMKIAIHACLLAILGATAAEAAQCTLIERATSAVPGCKVVVGYSAGKRVGEFRTQSGFERKPVGTTKACLNNTRYHTELGKIIAPNKLLVGSTTYVLAPDCKSSTKE
jgi:hypothetical protein